MKLILNQRTNSYVYLDAVVELEQAILSDHRVHRNNTMDKIVSATTYYLWRILKKTGYDISHVLRCPLFGKLFSRFHQSYFIVLMGLNARKFVPYFLLPGRKSIYLFDSWPYAHESIKNFVSYWGIDYIFVSSSQAAERLNMLINGCCFYWIPEGINPEEYRQYPYAKKDIDVLHLGRRYDAYHKLIIAPLKKAHKVYLYANIAKKTKM